ncbi:Trm112 family protein [Alkalimonas delamerensis]|uniref:UPF0434 protein Q3O59_07880 n=1 Tax=Alkalimonas delamerensis TaxID=265981 RepID=A0ABT9GPP8_9GAMM|nr:Trm112 family protein [Alkalimonas delamerensis]MDP4528945.1 Trm112 family protein [Alkalimonas delamerensis]
MSLPVALTEILACPLCKGKLKYAAKQQELICTFDKLAFPVRDQVPVMLESEARPLSAEELEAWTSS